MITRFNEFQERIGSASEAADSRKISYHSLARRMFLNGLIRYTVAGVFTLGGLLAHRVFEFLNSDVSPLFYVGLVIALYNTPVFLYVRRVCRSHRSLGPDRLMRGIMDTVIVLDFLVLAVVVYMLGGAGSPFLAFYLLHVTVSCVTLTRRTAITFTALAYFLIAVQVLGECMRIWPFDANPWNPGLKYTIDTETAVGILVVYGILFIMIDLILISVAEWLRRDERELRLKNAQLDRLSDIRRGFLHVALHNLKTPIGAAMMMLENLNNELAGPINDRQRDWINRCSVRLGGLIELLGDLQLLGDLETEALQDRFEPIEVAPMLRELVEEVRLNAQTRDQQITSEIPEDLPPVRGIERLMREAVINYLTNAIKYTPHKNVITLRARSIDNHHLRIEVQDTGPGISSENQKHLFQEFTRVDKAKSLKEGIPGSGLGLSIVKRIVDEHHGSVGVESEPGKGTTFYMVLPVAQPSRRES